MAVTLTFLGGVGTVTGSRFLLEADGRRILVDCGLFQGLKQLRLRNWAPFPVPPSSLDAVVLTHAHLDHSGYLPALVRDGFSGHVFCTPATRDLCDILLPDSGHLQELDAEFANRKGFSRHSPAKPLYTVEDALRSLDSLTPVEFGEEHHLPGGALLRFRRSGHILGAAIVEILWHGRRLVFSGDLGRYDDPVMPDPTPIANADYLLVESTYGDRRHDTRDPGEAIAEIVNRTLHRGGTVVIPAFAVGRAQTVLYHLSHLIARGRLPRVPVYLNSPMAIDASEVMRGYPEDHRLTPDHVRTAMSVARYVRTTEESKALNDDPKPKIIISASGMATGGRVLHHLKRFAPDPRSTILFTGFQAAGTRGAAMVGGAEAIKIHGEMVPIHAEVDNLPMLSAHADTDELMRWLRQLHSPPRMTFVTHGEPIASDTLRRRIQNELHWPVTVPEHRDTAELE